MVEPGPEAAVNCSGAGSRIASLHCAHCEGSRIATAHCEGSRIARPHCAHCQGSCIARPHCAQGSRTARTHG